MSNHMLRLDIPAPNLDTYNKSVVSVHASPPELTYSLYFVMLTSLSCHASMCSYNLDVACKQLTLVCFSTLLKLYSHTNVEFLTHFSLTVFPSY